MAKQTEAAKKEADRKKQIREKNKSSVISFFNNYIAGRKTKIKTKNKENAESLDAGGKAIAYCDGVRAELEKVREHVDALESLVDDKYWPIPKYRELLFIR